MLPYVIIGGLVMSILSGVGAFFFGEHVKTAEYEERIAKENAKQATTLAKADDANRKVEQQSSDTALALENQYGQKSVVIAQKSADINAAIPGFSDAIAGDVVRCFGSGSTSRAASVPKGGSPSAASTASPSDELSRRIQSDFERLAAIAAAADAANARNQAGYEFASEVQRINDSNATAAAGTQGGTDGLNDQKSANEKK